MAPTAAARTRYGCGRSLYIETPPVRNQVRLGDAGLVWLNEAGTCYMVNMFAGLNRGEKIKNFACKLNLSKIRPK